MKKAKKKQQNDDQEEEVTHEEVEMVMGEVEEVQEKYDVEEGVHEKMYIVEEVVGDVVPGTLHGVQCSQYLCDELFSLADD